ncbi:MAG: DUF92 domain-containing protein [Myxococcales bacterium]
MSDTLSSEIGGVFDSPRLITTLERVPPGTDGGVVSPTEPRTPRRCWPQ